MPSCDVVTYITSVTAAIFPGIQSKSSLSTFKLMDDLSSRHTHE